MSNTPILSRLWHDSKKSGVLCTSPKAASVLMLMRLAPIPKTSDTSKSSKERSLGVLAEDDEVRVIVISFF